MTSSVNIVALPSRRVEITKKTNPQSWNEALELLFNINVPHFPLLIVAKKYSVHGI